MRPFAWIAALGMVALLLPTAARASSCEGVAGPDLSGVPAPLVGNFPGCVGHWHTPCTDGTGATFYVSFAGWFHDCQGDNGFIVPGASWYTDSRGQCHTNVGISGDQGCPAGAPPADPSPMLP